MPFCEPAEILAGTCCGAVGGCSGGYASWITVSGAALMVSCVLLAFMYLWASLFRNPKLVSYVKSELLELVISGIILIFLFTAVGAVDSITIGSLLPASLIPDGLSHSATIYDVTAEYYRNVGSDMSGWLNMNYVVNMYVDQLASVTPYARPLGIGLVASPLAGVASPIKQLLYNMSVAVSVAFVINYAQLFVFIFSLQGFLNYYIPIGVFFRCFTPTRKLGGTLIGIGVTFLFLFPALTLISYMLFYSGGSPLLSFKSMLVYYLGPEGHFQQRFLDFYRGNFTASGGGIISLMTGVFGGIGGLLENVIGGIFLFLLLFPISTISWAFAIGFVVPVVNTMILIEGAKILSRSFGEEVDISALTRLV